MLRPVGHHLSAALLALLVCSPARADDKPKELAQFNRHDGHVWSVAVFPDGKHAISAAGDGSVRMWELATGKEVRTFDGHGAGVWSVVVTTDGKRVLTASEDKTVSVWDAG